tara:strand:- start:53 stop:421 length:369 start_codon:yes stop_codon:yes gene_type:complete
MVEMVLEEQPLQIIIQAVEEQVVQALPELLHQLVVLTEKPEEMEHLYPILSLDQQHLVTEHQDQHQADIFQVVAVVEQVVLVHQVQVVQVVEEQAVDQVHQLTLQEQQILVVEVVDQLIRHL